VQGHGAVGRALEMFVERCIRAVRLGPSSPAITIGYTLNAITAVLILRVFAPFCLGYFLSYLYRVVNAVMYRDLVGELNLPATALGLLTAAYFVTFGLAQLPLGLLLDRFGPRRVNAVLVAIAGGGAFAFAYGHTVEHLVIGRALIGLGCSAALMASFKAFVLWFPPDRQPAYMGWLLAVGGCGAMVGTAPIEFLLGWTGWRNVFVGLGVITLVVAALIAWVVPKEQVNARPETFRQLVDGLRQVLSSGFFWAIAWTVMAAQGAGLALQTLWVAPWLRDVMGIPRGEASVYLMLMNGALVVGFWWFGQYADRFTKVGVGPDRLLMLAVLMEAAMLLLLAFGPKALAIPAWVVFHFAVASSPVSYSLLARRFRPELTGRTSTSANMAVFVAAFALQSMIGAHLDLWPVGSGYDERGYAIAFMALAVLQVVAAAWLAVRMTRDRRVAPA